MNNANTDTETSLSYLISHPHHLAHLQVLHRRTQVSDRTESQTAVALVKVEKDIGECTMQHIASKKNIFISEMNMFGCETDGR